MCIQGVAEVVPMSNMMFSSLLLLFMDLVNPLKDCLMYRHL